MLMSVLMLDAKPKLTPEDQELLNRGVLAELLYADDTLLMGVNANSVERFMKAVSEAGGAYGLTLHWGKLQLLQVRCRDAVCRPDGGNIETKDSITYLGTTVSEDGRIGRELARRLGLANSDFRAMMRMWKHTTVSRARKLEAFRAIIESKLLYGLSGAWLCASERRRLDGFQNRCLRSLWGIKSAYVSRVSNKKVLEQTGQTPMSISLAKQQLLLFGKIAREPDGSILREAAFCQGSVRPTTERYVRVVGRPRLEWVGQVRELALQVAGDEKKLLLSIRNPDIWRNIVYYSQL
jgi:hypothetical protein